MLVAYDPRWPAEFQAAAEEIRDATGAAWEIEHIGSTAVPGLAAKPIIDLAVRVERPAEIDEYQDRLAAIHFVGVTGGPRTHRVLVRELGGRRTHLAHFFDAKQWEVCNQRIFRDWLLSRPEDRRRYEQVKRIAAEQATGGQDYTARKTAVVQDVVDRARAALGLPLVNVWDK